MKTITVDIKGILHPLGAPAYAAAYAIAPTQDAARYSVLIRSKTTKDEDFPAAVEAAESDFPDVVWNPTTPTGYYGSGKSGVDPAKAYTVIPFRVATDGTIHIDSAVDAEIASVGIAMRSFDPPAMNYGTMSSGFNDAKKRLDSLVKRVTETKPQ